MSLIEVTMPHRRRVGIQIDHDDPFWVQVREVIWQRASAFPVDLVEVAVPDLVALAPDRQIEAAESLLVQDLDALICNLYPSALLQLILDRGLAIIYVSESPLRHERFASRLGLFEAGTMLGRLIAARLSAGNVLLVGGLFEGDDWGHSRIDGFIAGLGPGSPLVVYHLPCPWQDVHAQPHIAAWLAAHPGVQIKMCRRSP
jgi:ABC-type sugar transport system substrate-binding protein